MAATTVIEVQVPIEKGSGPMLHWCAVHHTDRQCAANRTRCVAFCGDKPTAPENEPAGWESLEAGHCVVCFQMVRR